MRKLFSLLVLLVSATILSGCAANTSYFHIDTRHAYVAPSAPAADVPTVYIADITDGRKFVDKTSYPGDPTPAIASAEERARTVGRKRNGFGKAMGDYKLKDGQTVQTVIRSILEDALADSGFNVIHDASAVTKDTHSLNVSISKYWTWTDIDFWQIHLITDVTTDITDNKLSTFKIEATERLGAQLGTDKNVLTSMNNAIGKFRTEAINIFREWKKKIDAQPKAASKI